MEGSSSTSQGLASLTSMSTAYETNETNPDFQKGDCLNTKQIVDTAPLEANYYAGPPNCSPTHNQPYFECRLLRRFPEHERGLRALIEGLPKKKALCTQLHLYLFPLITSSNLNGSYLGFSHMHTGVAKRVLPKFLRYFLLAVEYHFNLAMPATFSQPRKGNLTS